MRIFFYESDGGCVDPRFQAELRRLLPTALADQCDIRPVPTQLSERLDSFTGEEWLLGLVIDTLGDGFFHDRLLIATTENGAFHRWCIRQVDHALWGCSDQMISVDYSPANTRLAVQLHEALHFFGVDDCYDVETKRPKPSCDNPKCLMRYGVVSVEVCNSVLEQLRVYGASQ